METLKYLLPEDRIPKSWYNLVSDLPKPPAPVLHPATHKPVTPDDLLPLFPMALIMQEASAEPRIEIPGPVRDVYRLWRPTPLIRARRLEKDLDTPARIYYKNEGVSPGGSHKPKGRNASRLRPARGSGAHRWRWRARSSASTAKSSWCG
jgi:tryptophan synthase beta chain